MKLYAPKYYENFICIADKCKHSCCIGWEIDIDKNTLLKYQCLDNPYAKMIKDSIINDGQPYFKLAENQRCLHLNKKGLCNIILNVGEDYLCDICREHPRFYNFTNSGKEVGLGLSCEEACRLILGSDNYDEIICFGEVSGEIDVCDFDALLERNKVYKILKNENLDFGSKVTALCNNFDIYLNEADMFKAVDKLEYLNVSHKQRLLSLSDYMHPKITQDMLTRILAYFVYRHCSESYDFDEFCIGLGFSIFCTKLIELISNYENIHEIARIVSEEIEYSEENTEKIKSLFY